MDKPLAALSAESRASGSHLIGHRHRSEFQRALICRSWTNLNRQAVCFGRIGRIHVHFDESARANFGQCNFGEVWLRRTCVAVV
ncbi:MAG TPA: hypothetical protein DDW52_19410 [Planctomycetaceae bacterium]|nr:hypothetical protein [Planctomycetaceae bacterium]